MATEAQIAANRINGLKGGVKTPEGKAISRMNALKHGIFATALMECPSDGFFSALLDELNEELKPVGGVEQLLVDKLAVTYLRMRRCAQAETMHFQQRWNFNPANFGKFPYDEAVVAIGLYDARLTMQFLRLLHEIEQRQKMRKAEEPRGESRDESRATQVKNEPNSAVSPVEPPETTEEMPDSRRSNARGCILRGGNDTSQARAPVPQEMKNEPNSGSGAPENSLAPRQRISPTEAEPGAGDDGPTISGLTVPGEGAIFNHTATSQAGLPILPLAAAGR